MWHARRLGQMVAENLPARPGQWPDTSATRADADTIAALCAEALASHQAGRLGEAIAQYDRLLQLKPGVPQLHNNRGLALAALDRLEEAIAAYRRAADIKADDPEVLCNWAIALAQLGHWDEAEAKLRRASAKHPGFAAAYNNLGLILRDRGRVGEAKSALEEAIRLSPGNAAYYDNLAGLGSFAGCDRYVATLEAWAQNPAALTATNRMHAHFALAKVYERFGSPAKAFAQLLAANALKRAQIAYDEAATLRRMERTRELFTRKFITDRQGCGEQSRVPIFIVGMPRSGTTLIEQILASHPDVFGAGELSLFEQAVGTVGGASTPLSFPDLLSGLAAAQLGDLGALYLQKLSTRVPRAARVTDKMPANFLFAGLIHLALPNATIIHAVRDPADTCVSCFSVHFTRGQLHTYDLGELGRYFRHYRMLMAHWSHVLPPGRIIEVQYEELVADVEGVARRLVDRCGLSWHPRCLDFHCNDRPVRTASALQVRQPVYGSAVGRWRRYQRFLGPLLAELVPPSAPIVAELRRAS